MNLRWEEKGMKASQKKWRVVLLIYGNILKHNIIERFCGAQIKTITKKFMETRRCFFREAKNHLKSIYELGLDKLPFVWRKLKIEVIG